MAEDARRLFAGPCRFLLGAAHLEQIPPSELAEVAFAGRSNVGKSSLLNALVGRHGLARTSNTPGRTQEINFFELDGALMLADLPGYGFAKAPKTKVDGWTRLVNAYLRGRAELRRCCILVDARHGLKDTDRHVMRMLDKAAQSYQVVLTKSDKVKPPELAAARDGVAAEIAKRPAAHPEIVVTSARKGLGIAELQAQLAALADWR